MHELLCPSCGTPSQFNPADSVLICQLCSTSFHVDRQTGQKEIFADHYIVPNVMDVPAIKEAIIEWLRRVHHKPGLADKEFVVIDIHGVSLPYWITSLDCHTVWKGLVRRKYHNSLNLLPGSDYLVEEGRFRRSYRWAVSARANLCEQWGITRLHEPKEDVFVEWDGFPLDSTFSRGHIDEGTELGKPVYEAREFFDYKYSNGLPILGVQVNEEEALRRAKMHTELYHYKLAKISVDYLLDLRTELEIAGIQLVHLPMWHATYQYRPKTILKNFYRPHNKHVLIEGHARGILKGELAMIHNDKVIVNSVICGAAAVSAFLLGASWHPAFFLVGVFAIIVAAMSLYLSTVRKHDEEIDIRVQHGGLGFGKESEAGSE